MSNEQQKNLTRDEIMTVVGTLIREGITEHEAIAAALKARGVVTRKGKPILPTAVRFFMPKVNSVKLPPTKANGTVGLTSKTPRATAYASGRSALAPSKVLTSIGRILKSKEFGDAQERLDTALVLIAAASGKL